MARPASFNKRENEKKKLSKRLDKQKRKEDRKSSTKASSFDDMIAYVDENGMIHDTPPEIIKNDEINAEDIMISIPKKAEEDPIRKGRVDYFTKEKGYGFIKDLETTDKHFFHIKNAPEGIGEGMTVLFEYRKGTGKKEITNIQISKP